MCSGAWYRFCCKQCNEIFVALIGSKNADRFEADKKSARRQRTLQIDLIKTLVPQKLV